MRATHRSSKGPKLYNVGGGGKQYRSRLEDIERYKQEHKRDITRRKKNEQKEN